MSAHVADLLRFLFVRLRIYLAVSALVLRVAQMVIFVVRLRASWSGAALVLRALC